MDVVFVSIFYDNTSAINIAKNHVQYKKTIILTQDIIYSYITLKKVI